MFTFTVLLRLVNLGKIVKADTIRIVYNFVVLVVFDFYLKMGIIRKFLFLSEVVTYILYMYNTFALLLCGNVIGGTKLCKQSITDWSAARKAGGDMMVPSSCILVISDHQVHSYTERIWLHNDFYPLSCVCGLHN